MEKVMERDSIQDVILEKVSIIIDIMMSILGCSYSEAYEIIVNTKTYHFLQERDYGTLHDSPQANLSSIGEELRQINNDIGNVITDENIKKAMIAMRNANLKKL
ncbi:MAG: hypothetical protein IJC02_08190 [Lachnospiraceae bacterium]|nr:hypothetical protein [Lachnospiraceae bacterium]MBQ6994031.1 hypothetical protein [Lachnospiraceae bacterium]